VIEPAAGLRNLSELLAARSGEIQEELLTHGALLFRGFTVRTLEDFDAAMTALNIERMDYVFGSTPRTALGKRIFSATEYPPAQEIPLHNENAYQRVWPLKISLCCLVPAPSGGETPIADMRAVGAILGDRLLDELETRGVRYVRHYRPYIDVPWQQVFGTTDRKEVARFCAEHDVTCEWLDQDTLRTTQDCQGVAHHPTTGERVFFNQAHLFHVSSLSAAAAQSLIQLYGINRLPRHAVYRDGSEIPVETLQTVRDAFSKATISFPWQRGDVLLVDNMQFAHGRRPFKGPRQVIVALLQPFSAWAGGVNSSGT
jgi:alpha-ketoglutarate-dependent taurine dioxygenase